VLVIDRRPDPWPLEDQGRPAPSTPALRVVPGPSAVDLPAAEAAVRALLEALGADVDDEQLRETPGRVAEAYAALLSPRAFDLTTFSNDGGYDELVVAHDHPFHSLCQGHVLPFVGVAHLGYLPADRILGLSTPVWSKDSPAACRPRAGRPAELYRRTGGYGSVERPVRSS
jgi:GTP cyclohydrolase I